MAFDVTTSNVREILDDNPMVGTRKGGTKRFWTKPELKKLHDTFPTGGIEACLPLLPGRTAGSIYQRASAEGLTAVQQRGAVPRQRWHSTPQIDALITRTMQGTPKDGELRDLAKTLGRPKWWVRNRARRLGLTPPRFKEPPWTEPEIDIVASNAHRAPATIVRMLKRKNFVRTETAVIVKLKRIGVPRGRNADLDHYTANALAKLFGVDSHVVMAWIKKGWLKAGVRDSTAERPESWIHRRDVRAFIIDNVAAIDIRKVEKFWFIEMLTQGDAK